MEDFLAFLEIVHESLHNEEIAKERVFRPTEQRVLFRQVVHVALDDFQPF